MSKSQLHSRPRLGRLTAPQYVASREMLNELWGAVDVVELDADLMLSAADVAARRGLRGYDAVHCAAAAGLRGEDVVAAAGDATSGWLVGRGPSSDRYQRFMACSEFVP